MTYSDYNLQLLSVLNCRSILHSVKKHVQLVSVLIVNRDVMYTSFTRENYTVYDGIKYGSILSYYSFDQTVLHL